MFIFLSLYLIGGIVGMVPILVLGATSDNVYFDEDEIDLKWLLITGVKILPYMLIWPYWVGKVIYISLR